MQRYKARMVWIGLFIIGILGLSGCGTSLDDPAVEKANGGEVLVDFPADWIRKELIAAHTPGIDENTTVFGYKAYRITYETIDEKGNPVLASGLMTVPTDYGVTPIDAQKLAYMKSKGFSLVSDAHGTIFANYEAPTEVAKTTLAPEGAPVIFTALAGFVTLQADYIGFGASKDHIHPYLLKEPSARTIVDFIHAARAFAKANDIPLNGQLFVTGYSEGGYVALAALQTLEAEGEPVYLAAPMAGPYMLDVMAKGVLSQDALPIPSFMADVAYAYAEAYEQPYESLINEPYASQLPELFDGTLDRKAIDAKLPHVTSELFSDEVITRVLQSDETYWFNQALFANATAYWAPQTSVRLLHCEGDDVVPYAMSEGTASVMRDQLGASDVAVVPVEQTAGLPVTLGHVDCAPVAYKIAAEMFGAVRAHTIGY